MKILTEPVWRSVIGGFLIHLVLGNLYSWGIITTAVTAYLRKFDSSLEYNDTILVYITQLAFVGINMGIGGVLQVYIGCRTTSLLGGLLVCFGAFLSAFAKSLSAIIFTYGFLFGSGIGIAYSAPIVCATKWRPESKAVIAGIILAGFGGGSFVFGLIDTCVLHYNLPPGDDSLVDGYFASNSKIAGAVPRMFFIISASYLAFVIVGCYLMQELRECDDVRTNNVGVEINNPVANLTDRNASTDDKDCRRYGNLPTTDVTMYDIDMVENEDVKPSLDTQSGVYARIATESIGESSSHPICNDFRCSTQVDTQELNSHCSNNGAILSPVRTVCLDIGPNQILSHPIGWHIMSCYALTAIAGIFITGTYKTFGLHIFHDDASLSIIGSVASLFSVTGRITWGALADRHGITTTLCLLSLAFALLLFTYSSAAALLGEVGFSLWTFAIFMVEGGIFSLYLPLSVQLFGPKNAGGNYGVFFFGFSVCNVCTVLSLSQLDVDFVAATVSLGSLTLLGCFDVFWLRHNIFQRFGLKT